MPDEIIQAFVTTLLHHLACFDVFCYELNFFCIKKQGPFQVPVFTFNYSTILCSWSVWGC